MWWVQLRGPLDEGKLTCQFETKFPGGWVNAHSWHGRERTAHRRASPPPPRWKQRSWWAAWPACPAACHPRLSRCRTGCLWWWPRPECIAFDCHPRLLKTYKSLKQFVMLKKLKVGYFHEFCFTSIWQETTINVRTNWWKRKHAIAVTQEDSVFEEWSYEQGTSVVTTKSCISKTTRRQTPMPELSVGRLLPQALPLLGPTLTVGPKAALWGHDVLTAPQTKIKPINFIDRRLPRVGWWTSDQNSRQVLTPRSELF